mmetsp:Transcript_12192/g.17368  ORF Transcript_12192/g.17368 Transcript_12192/m.17368 type:complete len:148 (+) Transcript_12192:61-504(+)
MTIGWEETTILKQLDKYTKDKGVKVSDVEIGAMRGCYKNTAIGELGGALTASLLVSLRWGGPSGVWRANQKLPFFALAVAAVFGGETGRIYGSVACMRNLLSLERNGSHVAFATRQLMLASPKKDVFIKRYNISTSRATTWVRSTSI